MAVCWWCGSDCVVMVVWLWLVDAGCGVGWDRVVVWVVKRLGLRARTRDFLSESEFSSNSARILFSQPGSWLRILL